MITKYLIFQFPQGVYSLSFLLQQKYPKPLWADESLQQSTTLNNTQTCAFPLRIFLLKSHHEPGLGETWWCQTYLKVKTSRVHNPNGKKKTNNKPTSFWGRLFSCFQKCFQASVKVQNIWGLAQRTPPSFSANIAKCQGIFFLFCPEMSFFPSSCSLDREGVKNVLLLRLKFPFG